MLLIPRFANHETVKIKDRVFSLECLRKADRVTPFLILRRVPDKEPTATVDPGDFFTFDGHLYQVKEDGKSITYHGFIEAFEN